LIAKQVRPVLSKPIGVKGRRQDRMTDKEKERRYYQGPSERISLNQETEYMTASQPKWLTI